MKKGKRFLSLLVTAIFALSMFAAVACGDAMGAVVITLSPPSLTLTEGGASGTITATVVGSNEEAVWSVVSGNEYITINAVGKTCVVTPVAKGNAKLKITVGDTSKECTVTVNEAQTEDGHECEHVCPTCQKCTSK